jgi:acyl-CoA thioester hydrolase
MNDRGVPLQTRRTRVRVRYAETDRMGVVYYANYLVWFEVGRTEWLRDTGWSYREMEHEGVSLPVIEAHCEYRQAARYDEEIEIRTRATLLTAVRIRFDYEVLRPGVDVPAAIGHTVHASLDSNGRPCRLPTRVRQLLGDRERLSPGRKPARGGGPGATA